MRLLSAIAPFATRLVFFRDFQYNFFKDLLCLKIALSWSIYENVARNWLIHWEQIKRSCLEYFTWLQSIRSNRWKAFFPNQVRFSRNFGFLRRFLRLVGKIFGYLKTLFVPFIVLKTTVSITRFRCKNRFEKRTTLGRDIWEKTKLGCGLVWRSMFKNIFANISAQGGLFF